MPPETDPPPQQTPPPDPTPPTPPAPPVPPVTGGTGPPEWLQGLLDAVGSIPEKVAAAVKEQTPAPAPPPKTTEERREDGNKILQDAGKPPVKAAESRKRTFADRWFGT